MRRLTDWLLWGLVLALLSANLVTNLNVSRVTNRLGEQLEIADAHLRCRAMGYVIMEDVLRSQKQ